MVEDDTPNRRGEEEDTPLVIPTHAPLPPPPDVFYTRPLAAPKISTGPGFGTQQSSPSENSSVGSGAVKLGSGLAAATTFAASIIAGFLIGQWIDHRWNHSGGLPWGTIVFSLAGVAAGFLNLFRVLSATDRGKK
jgi:F0F1-type ATP synthase assembly protein I